MIPAKNNIIVKIRNSNTSEYAILNPISGNFDLMDESEYNLLRKMMEGEAPDIDFSSYLLERGYAFENQEDQSAAVNKAYREFKEEVAESQVQLMLVPTYSCNLACTYCFQHGIQRGTYLSLTDASLHLDNRPTLITKEIVDAFFDYAGKNFPQGKQRPFITLFGGEPLVNSPAQRNIIQYIVDKCADENYELSAVTNGYDFIEYVNILKKARIKEIQFTLDGSKDIHDNRRATVNKKGTFDRIVAGIEAAVINKMPVNLRSVVDTENIKDIVNLAEFLDKKGWLDLPPELFKTQIGRNYELFDCYAKPQHLMTQVELWGEFASSSKVYPVLAKFHRPDFKGIRHLVDTGEMYMASFDTCPACKTEWVFDLYGNIYGCTASCGREEYLLGTFWPEVNLNAQAINTWQKRDVKSIPECRDCKYDVICGGGCGVVAANQNNGNILSPDCRPIQELVEIGVNHYIDNIKAITEEKAEDDIVKENVSTCCCGQAEPKKVSSHKSDKAKPASCCEPKYTVRIKAGRNDKPGHMAGSEALQKEQPRKTEGCVICGEELVYSKDTPTKETCYICGHQFEAYVKCPKGHYICDTCHSMDILGKVEQLLTASEEQNPVVLAQKVFELPGLNMHGPEYHSIVPSVLVAAYQNLTGKKDISKIREAIKRGKDVKGGNCGFLGNCGSGVGSGIAVSILESATPMSRDERGAANRATGYALLEISKHGGPRCCKREAITSIQSFLQVTNYFSGIQISEYTCKQFGKNKDCIGRKCPYFPIKS